MNSGDATSEHSMLREVRDEVAIADHKASLVLAALGIGFGALLGGLMAGDWSPEQLGGLAGVLWWAGAGAALTSVTCAAVAVWPRYKKADVANGIFYWGHIATFNSLEEYLRALDAQGPTDIDRARHQLWHLSRLVDGKYTLVRGALVAAGGAALLLLAASVS